MRAMGIPAYSRQIAAPLKEDEAPALEFKCSTGKLKEGMQALCPFLNGSGGMVVFGVRPEGPSEGQTVSNRTLRDIAQAVERFEPPAHVSIHRIKLKVGREVVVAAVEGCADVRPFTCHLRRSPLDRVATATRRTPQEKPRMLKGDARASQAVCQDKEIARR